MGEEMTALVTTENMHFFDMESRKSIWD